MITYTLDGFGTSEAAHWTFKGELFRVKSGELASYVCRLYGSKEQMLGEAILTDYPRWVEPVGLIVARAIDVVLKGLEYPPEMLPQRKGVITVWLDTRLLMSLPFSKANQALRLPRSRIFQLADDHSGWPLAAKVLCAEATGAFTLPPVPPPLRPITYVHEGVRYCRSSDLAPEVRAAFEWNRRYSTCPAIPGVSDAYYLHDLVSFILG